MSSLRICGGLQVSVLEKMRQGSGKFEASLAYIVHYMILLGKKKRPPENCWGQRQEKGMDAVGGEGHRCNFASSRQEGPLSQKASSPRDATTR